MVWKRSIRWDIYWHLASWSPSYLQQ
jgi:hypothetical protein